jgi:hypothetical protein
MQRSRAWTVELRRSALNWCGSRVHQHVRDRRNDLVESSSPHRSRVGKPSRQHWREPTDPDPSLYEVARRQDLFLDDAEHEGVDVRT